jgi:hypothetical protein
VCLHYPIELQQEKSFCGIYVKYASSALNGELTIYGVVYVQYAGKQKGCLRYLVELCQAKLLNQVPEHPIRLILKYASLAVTENSPLAPGNIQGRW